MAITISTSISKKVPIPGTDFSSRQASIMITAEVADLSKVAAEAQRLYDLAVRSVDEQLGISPPASTLPPVETSTPAAPSRASAPPRTSAPYPRQGARRPPAPATDSQLRFLDRLITQTGTSADAICSAHQVGALADLSCKEAAGVIDELKSRVAA